MTDLCVAANQNITHLLCSNAAHYISVIRSLVVLMCHGDRSQTTSK